MSDRKFCDWRGCDKQLIEKETEENWFREPDLDFCAEHWKQIKKLLRPGVLD